MLNGVNMKKATITVLLVAAQFAVLTCANAAEHGNEAEAQAMVVQAVALIKSAGADTAYKAFTDHPGGAFKDRDMYVFAYGYDGTCIAQGANPKMVGKNLLGIKDVDGNAFIKGEIDLVKSKGKGWYGPYKFNNPNTNTYEEKKSYCEQGAPNTIVCVGIYQTH